MRITVFIAFVLTAATAGAQVPNPAPALAAARDAKAKTEAAQQKNAEALGPGATGAPGAQGASGAGATGAAGAPGASGAGATGAAGAQGASGAGGYTYDPAGRRDPFVSLLARGGDLPAPTGARPAGVPGLLISEVNLKGVFKSKTGFIALLQGPDNRTYIVHAGEKVFDGSIKAINQDAVVFSQDVNDPLSLVKQREVRKSIRAEAR